jgi:hypothetical protein
MGNNCIKGLYNKMPIREKCGICKKYRYIGGDETGFRIATHGCKICRLKTKYIIKQSKLKNERFTRGRYY